MVSGYHRLKVAVQDRNRSLQGALSSHLLGVVGQHVQRHDPQCHWDATLREVWQPFLSHQPLPELHVEGTSIADKGGRQQYIAHQFACMHMQSSQTSWVIDILLQVNVWLSVKDWQKVLCIQNRQPLE